MHTMNLSDLLRKIYTEDNLSHQLQRYEGLIKKFSTAFKHKECELFSSPGRTEICGNHTDHNNGKVIAASINLDIIAAAAINNENVIRLFSEGYKEPYIVDLDNVNPLKEEKNSTHALIRGVAAGFRKHGFIAGGFDACIMSDVLVGSGLSSSASIEVLIGTILNVFFNNNKVPDEHIALIGQYAENVFFGKPCGLMDQVACAVGGIISIDFNNPDMPIINKIDFNFHNTGYRLVVVDSGASHADLTDHYAAIPAEMKLVAAHFNISNLREVSLDNLLKEIKLLREKTGDRAILRAIHFLAENSRVDKQISALSNNNFNEFLSLVNESGTSSYKYLQNIYSPDNIKEQGVSLALALSDMFIKDKGKGACRIHGGGFAGTILLFLPEELVNEYTYFITQVFNKDSVNVLTIRNKGSLYLGNFCEK